MAALAAPRERSPISFHSIRHTATSLLKAAGVSEAAARDIIGHESAEISRHYTHVDDEAKRVAVDKLPDLSVVRLFTLKRSGAEPSSSASIGATSMVEADNRITAWR